MMKKNQNKKQIFFINVDTVKSDVKLFAPLQIYFAFDFCRS